MTKMRAVVVSSANAAFELVERDIPTPGRGKVRLRIDACGVCHSDYYTKLGTYPSVTYPRVPGHEVAGVVDAVGEDVGGWKPGDRAGVGWHGGNCGWCDACRRGMFVSCRVAPQVTGITMDGGYEEFMIAPAGALAHIPDELTAADAAPLMCAGVTTFNALRNSGAQPGDTVAVLGVGGLGHLAVQFASKMGFRTIAIARGAEKAPLAKELGAWRYLDSQKDDPAAELVKMGGARVVLATVTNGPAMNAVIPGLGLNGRFVAVGAPPEPLQVAAGFLIGGRRAISGWPSGSSIDSQDALAFAALTGVRSRNEIFPLERASDAYDRMMSGKARFRVVLTMGRG
ncbi:MAG: alcohol dehydrogenase [Thermoanaerobaculia bacterium]